MRSAGRRNNVGRIFGVVALVVSLGQRDGKGIVVIDKSECLQHPEVDFLQRLCCF